jgi:hypothetical protein
MILEWGLFIMNFRPLLLPSMSITTSWATMAIGYRIEVQILVQDKGISKGEGNHINMTSSLLFGSSLLEA